MRIEQDDSQCKEERGEWWDRGQLVIGKCGRGEGWQVDGDRWRRTIFALSLYVHKAHSLNHAMNQAHCSHIGCAFTDDTICCSVQDTKQLLATPHQITLQSRCRSQSSKNVHLSSTFLPRTGAWAAALEVGNKIPILSFIGGIS